MRALRRFVKTLALALAATFSESCSNEWDQAAPAIPLGGDKPLLGNLQKLNVMPSGNATLMQGPDGAWWTQFCEFRYSATGRGGPCKRTHLVRLPDSSVLGTVPIVEETRESDDVVVRFTALYELTDDTKDNMRSIRIHRPGSAEGSDASFKLPAGKFLPLYIADGGSDDVFVYWLLDAATTYFDIYRGDRKYQRRLPVPPGVDPANPGASMEFQLTSDGGTLVLVDPTKEMFAYSTLDEGVVALGKRTTSYLIDNQARSVLVIGDDFRAVPLDGGPDRVLATQKIDPSNLGFDAHRIAWFVSGGDLYRVALDGSGGAEKRRSGVAHLWSIGPHEEVVYSQDPSSRFANGAGDGWIDDARFMERGRIVRWNAAGTRLHFLEHAAQTGTVGSLSSVAVPLAANAGAVTLGINVHSYRELPDGRVLAIENHAYAGSWSRLVVIDEAAGTKQWVVPSANEFFLVPDNKQVIADVVSGASGVDVYRVPVP